MKREEVEALMSACEPGSETFVEAMDKLSRRKVAALCRAWLAVDAGLRVYVGRVYDCDVGEDRGEILRTLPESMIGFVSIVPVERGDERPTCDTPPAPRA